MVPEAIVLVGALSAVGSIVSAVGAWLSKSRSAHRTIKIELPDGTVVSTDRMSEEQRKQLIQELGGKKSESR
jgi:hypothetical protein